MRLHCEVQIKDSVRRELLIRELLAHGFSPKVLKDVVTVEHRGPLLPTLVDLIQLVDSYLVDEKTIILEG